MSNKKKILLVVLLLWGLWALSYFAISFDIKGPKMMKLDGSATYLEPGMEAFFFNSKLKVSTKKEETSFGYRIVYSARNPLGVKKSVKRNILIEDTEKPVLTLQGANPLYLSKGTPYVEKGYHAEDVIDGDLTEKVTINGKVDSSKEGTYEITYQVKDNQNNTASVVRKVVVGAATPLYQARYDELDNTSQGWWSGNKKDHVRPLQGAGSTVEHLKQYNAYYMGPDDKTIYLTFDEGSNDTYVDEIIDTLDKNGIKGTFFLCGNYIKSNEATMKKLASGGHSVGNHTYYHKNMPALAYASTFQEYVKEITSNEEIYYRITGTAMDKVYREPRGEWSDRSLAIMKDLGYKSYFWSADYLDYDGEKSKEQALEEWMTRYHNGAIYLIHPKTKGNAEALDSFIKEMTKLGYRFGLVRDIS